MANVQDFPWLKATPEQQAAVLQSMFTAFFVSPATNRIAAVTPRPELRLYMQERIYVGRRTTEWAVLENNLADYDAPMIGK